MELAGGAVILVAGAGARLKRELADAADAAAAAAKARRTAPCPAVSGDGGNGGSDAALLERLTTLSALAHGSARGFGCGPGGGGGGGRSKQGGRTCETLDGLRLVSRDVAKVCAGGVWQGLEVVSVRCVATRTAAPRCCLCRPRQAARGRVSPRWTSHPRVAALHWTRRTVRQRRGCQGVRACILTDSGIAAQDPLGWSAPAHHTCWVVLSTPDCRFRSELCALLFHL